MGTDIHGVWQKKTQTGWEDINSNYEQQRHYQLFSILAGVRNGIGFAGVPTGDKVVPIAELRGLPADFELVREDANDDIPSFSHVVQDVENLPPWLRDMRDAPPYYMWMGDHSFSRLSGEEMLSWFESAPTVTHVGVMPRRAYENWNKVDEPEEYYGDVYGAELITIDESERETTNKWTHIRVEWQVSLKDEVAYFVDEVRRLVNQHGEIRFVFGFDS